MEHFKTQLMADTIRLYQAGKRFLYRYPVTCTMMGLGVYSWLAPRKLSLPSTTYLMFSNRSSSSIETILTAFAVFKQPFQELFTWYWYGREIEDQHPTTGSFLRHLLGNSICCLGWLVLLRREFSHNPDLRWCLGSALLYSQLIHYTSLHKSTSISIFPGVTVKGAHAPWYLIGLHILTGTWIEEYFLGMLAGVSYLMIASLYRKWWKTTSH